MVIKLVVQSVEVITSKKDGAKYNVVTGFEAPPGRLGQFVKWFVPRDMGPPKPGTILSLEVTEVVSDKQNRVSLRGVLTP